MTEICENWKNYEIEWIRKEAKIDKNCSLLPKIEQNFKVDNFAKNVPD